MNSNNCGCAQRGEKAEALGRGDRAALEASEEPVLTDNVLTLNNEEKTASWGKAFWAERMGSAKALW